MRNIIENDGLMMIVVICFCIGSIGAIAAAAYGMKLLLWDGELIMFVKNIIALIG